MPAQAVAHPAVELQIGQRLPGQAGAGFAAEALAAVVLGHGFEIRAELRIELVADAGRELDAVLAAAALPLRVIAEGHFAAGLLGGVEAQGVGGMVVAEGARAVGEFRGAEQAPRPHVADHRHPLQPEGGIAAAVHGGLPGLTQAVVRRAAELQFGTAAQAQAQQAVVHGQVAAGAGVALAAPVGQALFVGELAGVQRVGGEAPAGAVEAGGVVSQRRGGAAGQKGRQQGAVPPAESAKIHRFAPYPKKIQ